MSRLTESPAWNTLQNDVARIRATSLRALFAADPDRYPRMTVSAGPLFLDYSKNLLDHETLSHLLALAEQEQLPQAIRHLFNGATVNRSEGRAALHTALRQGDDAPPLWLHGQDVSLSIHQVLAQMTEFVEQVHSGTWQGYSGHSITDVVNIGIGGSDLGPAAVMAALPADWVSLRVHYVSNVDGAQLSRTLKPLNPETTLFIVASKTFTTQETLLNAHSARTWFMERAKDPAHIARHFVALSTNATAVAQFGIDTRNMFAFWDWVGGRYSLWSAIGLSIALGIGMDKFRSLLAGAHAMDSHFRDAPLAENMPVLMGLIGIWYLNFMGAQTQAILPYDQGLERLVAHIQQVSMESTGKSVTQEGKPVDYATGAIIWGGAGTNGQHAYYQLLHQGTFLIPADFILPLHSRYPLGDHHRILSANVLAQGEALMRGKTAEEVKEELAGQNLPPEQIQTLLPHKIFPGNRPCNTLLLNQVDPYTLGALVALYEHRTFVQGTLWGIDTFDQWGVELGKQLARTIDAELKDHPSAVHDPSTTGLIERVRSAMSPSSSF
jgi:glucose-6-phosphate isomerase (EC 5.3.1.9)